MSDFKNQLVYLKPNVVPEALFNQWYVNSHLISPLTAALNINGRHLKIMKSYMEHPNVHALAVQKPEMRGGPFIDYKGERVDEIELLYNKTVEENQELIALAEATIVLNNLLLDEATGYSMKSIYKKIPPPLRGYVELIYDLNSRPSFRLIESLLYRNYYKESSQSISFQLIESDCSRSFVLSTPRLEEQHVVKLCIPYRHEGIDELFRMLKTPGPYDRIKEMLGVDQTQEYVFKTFFTEEPPIRYQGYNGSGIRTRYFGHASILIETSGINILVDPLISYEYNAELPRYTFNDLPDRIDYVLITHNHQDHVNIETLIQLRHKVKNIIVPRCGLGNLLDPSLKIMFNEIGFSNIMELGELEKVELEGCVIYGLPFFGEHSDLDVRSKLCYHIRLSNDLTILLASDSCNIQPDTYELIKSFMGEVDVLFLGMECDGAPLSWVYGPLMPKELTRDKDQSRRLAGCNFEEALGLVNCFNPSDVFVYAMGMEPWLEYISSVKYTDESRPVRESNKLIMKCKSAGITAERLYGEKTIEYDRNKVTRVLV